MYSEWNEGLRIADMRAAQRVTLIAQGLILVAAFTVLIGLAAANAQKSPAEFTFEVTRQEAILINQAIYEFPKRVARSSASQANR